MIFAEKLILLRKKSGWSQEEIADQMKVSRQSVSKWEGAQSIPDLEKLIRLSDLFGVSLDYLLKDHIEKAEDIQSDEARVCPRRVSMEEAHAFLTVREQTAPRIAFATLLCVLLARLLFYVERDPLSAANRNVRSCVRHSEHGGPTDSGSRRCRDICFRLERLFKV